MGVISTDANLIRNIFDFRYFRHTPEGGWHWVPTRAASFEGADQQCETGVEKNAKIAHTPDDMCLLGRRSARGPGAAHARCAAACRNGGIDRDVVPPLWQCGQGVALAIV